MEDDRALKNKASFEKSETIAKITQALIDFHAKVGTVAKNESNPFFKSKYAGLPDILSEIDKPLRESGLSFVQFPTGENELTTVLTHTSGEYFQGTFKMTPVKNDPQGAGSVITYQRRYALGAILGLNIDEDDDGNKASGLKADTKPVGRTKPTKQELFDAIKVVREKVAAGEPIDKIKATRYFEGSEYVEEVQTLLRDYDL